MGAVAFIRMHILMAIEIYIIKAFVSIHSYYINPFIKKNKKKLVPLMVIWKNNMVLI